MGEILHLSMKYRLIWDSSTKLIKNDYTRDYSGTQTSVVILDNMCVIESDDYQDIINKVNEENLTLDPSLFL